ncbi:hypothetical protein P280DRAFT_477706 [Massarina eburnea CBS 473.64]|uniref:Uncharacterized protein n=1 Tax=Massarina eburnea CBS 473.64 TaxID=1395130 RepID=A0A6A6S989_9PLEO|nr:hypothetical protein P280DRAFT_477706 [Massarina eburnea CBS 473.64]
MKAGNARPRRHRETTRCRASFSTCPPRLHRAAHGTSAAQDRPHLPPSYLPRRPRAPLEDPTTDEIGQRDVCGGGEFTLAGYLLSRCHSERPAAGSDAKGPGRLAPAYRRISGRCMTDSYSITAAFRYTALNELESTIQAERLRSCLHRIWGFWRDHAESFTGKLGIGNSDGRYEGQLEMERRQRYERKARARRQQENGRRYKRREIREGTRTREEQHVM